MAPLPFHPCARLPDDRSSCPHFVRHCAPAAGARDHAAFLGTHHCLPIATFHQEWLPGVLGLAAILVLASRTIAHGACRTQPCCRSRTRRPALAAGGHRPRRPFEASLIASLYLVWAFLLMLAMRCIADDLGRDKSAELLAGALLAGALLLAFTGALQRWAPWLGHAVGISQRDDEGQRGSSRTTSPTTCGWA